MSFLLPDCTSIFSFSQLSLRFLTICTLILLFCRLLILHHPCWLGGMLPIHPPPVQLLLFLLNCWHGAPYPVFFGLSPEFEIMLTYGTMSVTAVCLYLFRFTTPFIFLFPPSFVFTSPWLRDTPPCAPRSRSYPPLTRKRSSPLRVYND